ncbi:MAG: hypothetical protein CVT84_17575 [Alphaproteobacteria bacterium HGW-Alphaproteobacteria-6]|jgi:hypothetical protein|nr:MAG: hypothetical protein CVT84_17575 [Alphaproteobacteria bacterium HGW-Alphaproteobacteria-6]
MRLFKTAPVYGALVVFATAGLALADNTNPSGNKVFEGFDNPAPGDLHPGLTARADRAVEATDKDGDGVGNEGPWSAHQNSDQIDCQDCP